MNEKPSVAVIGLGTMGSRIAARLLAQGWHVAVYNRSQAAALALTGARVAGTAADAVKGCGVVLTCLRGSDVELDTVLGSHGFLAALQPGAVHVSLSTLSPEAVKQLAQAHRAHGTRYLSCQMQGRAQVAEAGQLVLWASGPKADLESVAPVLQCFSAHTCHLGEAIELAAAAKLAVNLLMFANIELFAETSNYLHRAGIDPSQVFGVLTSSMFATPLFKGIAAALRGSHESDGTSVATSLVDLQLLLAHAQAIGAPLPAAAAVAAQYERTVQAGHGAMAQSAVLLSLAKP